MANLLCDLVLRQIDASYHIEFHWGRDRSWTGHTSIVIKFSGEPLFTLDFGPSDGQSGTSGSIARSSKASVIACTALALRSSVFVNGYEFSRTNIETQLLDFAIDTITGKNRAIDLLLELSRIEMGDYHYLKNNCRDFVSKAMEIIHDNRKQFDDVNTSGDFRHNRGQQAMQKMKHEDESKVLGAKIAAGVALAGGLYGIYKLFTSNEKKHENQ